MKKKTFLLISLIILIGFGFLFFSTSSVNAESDYEIGYYFPPYTPPYPNSFVNGGYYKISSDNGFHHFICYNCWQGFKYGDTYKGVVGNSEIISGMYLGSGADEKTFDVAQLGNWTSAFPLQEGDNLFIAIYEYTPEMRNYFLTGTPPSEMMPYATLSFHYGEGGMGYIPEIPETFEFEFEYPYPFGTSSPPTIVYEKLTGGINYILNPLGNWTNFFVKFFDPNEAIAKANEIGEKIKIIKSYFNYFDNFFGGFPVALIFSIFLIILMAKIVFNWVAKIINLIKP